MTNLSFCIVNLRLDSVDYFSTVSPSTRLRERRETQSCCRPTSHRYIGRRLRVSTGNSPRPVRKCCMGTYRTYVHMFWDVSEGRRRKSTTGMTL